MPDAEKAQELSGSGHGTLAENETRRKKLKQQASTAEVVQQEERQLAYDNRETTRRPRYADLRGIAKDQEGNVIFKPGLCYYQSFRIFRHKVFRYGKVTFSSLHSQPNRSFSTKN